MKRNAVKEDVWAKMKADNQRRREEQSRRRGEVLRALDVSPAVSGVREPGTKYASPRMAIVSGEISDHAAGKFRVTFFGPDGPHGHMTHPTREKIADEIASSFDGPYKAMTDDDVMAWTSTPEFIRGAKVTAFVQADNYLRYRASQLGRGEWAQKISSTANMLGIERVDEALEMLHAAIRELPTPNPRGRLVANPPWVTKVLADSYEVIDDKVPARWLPQLAAVARQGRGIVADLVEYGCGAYGCVLATLDPDTVLKVTSDETEAEFAAKFANDLVAPVCVDYRMVVRVDRKREGRQIYLLWRESAQHVGNIDEAIGGDGPRANLIVQAIGEQHRAAQVAFLAFTANEYTGKGAHHAQPYIEEWLDAVKAMGDAVPELEPLARGLRAVWDKQRILFGDIHAGNLGMVTRGGRDMWVITDPGNIAVVQ